jgi:hypothetical protein
MWKIANLAENEAAAIGRVAQASAE